MPKEHEPLEEETWDKKKIATGFSLLILVVALVFVTKNYILPKFGIIQPASTQDVKGIETQAQPANQSTATFSLPSTQDVQDKIQSIQEQVTHLNVGDVTSSSPQIQAIIQQLKELPQLPADQAKQACINLCGKL